MFFYSDISVRTGTPVNVASMNATKAYLRHYDNMLFLDFMAKNGTRIERVQADREMAICRRKMQFWERHPNFSKEEASRGCIVAKRNWSQSSTKTSAP